MALFMWNKKRDVQPATNRPHRTQSIENTPGKTWLQTVVDDFSIKYTKKHDAKHSMMALKEIYKMTIDWKGEIFVGVTLAWNYMKQHVDLSMPNYVPAALHKFQHKAPNILVNLPHACAAPIY
eukprot:14570915-Ditylum_brightwellii.AAC.1